jgi:transposase
MEEIELVRRKYYEEGKTISDVYAETGIDRKTIRKYVNRQDWNLETNDKSARSKIEPYKKEIDGWLEDDKKRKKKQRHTARRALSRLKEKYPGIDLSYRTVAYYVKEKRKDIYSSAKESFLPLEHKPGEAQIDFGKAVFIEKGIEIEGSYLAVSFPYSNAGFIQLFKGENFECFAFGMKTIFNYIGGVPHRQWYDNTKILVIKILKGHDRKLTESYIRFKEHYNFTSVFCNADAGHEKGNVENKVGYSRRNMLVPVPEFDDINEFNKELLRKCKEDMNRPHYKKNQSISSLFEEDLNNLNAVPSAEFQTETYVTARTDAYGRFPLDQCFYSSSPSLSCSTVTVVKSHDTVTVLDKNKEVVRHKRLYGEKLESFDWIPYLKQLSRKPAALKYTGVYSMLPLNVRNFLEVTDKSKFLKLLAELTEETGFNSALSLIEDAMQYDITDLDSIIALKRSYGNLDMKPLISADIPQQVKLDIDIEKYNLFLSGRQQ